MSSESWVVPQEGRLGAGMSQERTKAIQVVNGMGHSVEHESAKIIQQSGGRQDVNLLDIYDLPGSEGLKGSNPMGGNDVLMVNLNFPSARADGKSISTKEMSSSWSFAPISSQRGTQLIHPTTGSTNPSARSDGLPTTSSFVDREFPNSELSYDQMKICNDDKDDQVGSPALLYGSEVINSSSLILTGTVPRGVQVFYEVELDNVIRTGIR